MLKKAIRYGGGAGLALCLVFTVTFFLIEKEEPNYELGEVIGYVSFFLALLVVFFGIRSYRDEDLGGVITFGKALQTGMLITAFTAGIFAVFDTLYVTVLNPDFFTEYMDWEMGVMRANGATQAALDAYEAQYMAFQGPFGFLLNAAIMFLTVILIGFIVSIVSAWLLRKRAQDAGAAALSK